MKVLYVSSVPSKKQFDYMISKQKKNYDFAKYGMKESGFKFHSLMMKGMAHDKSHSIESLVGRPLSFQSHKGIFWKSVKESDNNMKYDHMSVINLPIIKNITISMICFIKTLFWLLKNRKETNKMIVFDAAYVTIIPFINAATSLIKCKKIAIVCDIYEYMGEVKDARKESSIIHKWIRKIIKKSYTKTDGFVFLTEAMNEVLNPKNKPYLVMEGLVDSSMAIQSIKNSKKNKKDIVFYAGALRSQYGLKNLVEGFMDYVNEGAELWLYGEGDYVPEIEKHSKQDKRIHYGGMLANEKIVEKEMESTILVNPRDASQEFTKYSFPSKNMEYMVSGTPVLTTRLPGMPKEYYQYVYTIDGNNKEDITKALLNTLSIDKKELKLKGIEAKSFVLNKKNNLIQAKRILDFGVELINEDYELF